MKKFWLFAGSNYYPKGGMLDFKDSYDTLEEAIEVHIKFKESEDSYEFAWCHIYNSETKEIDYDTGENDKEDYKM